MFASKAAGRCITALFLAAVWAGSAACQHSHGYVFVAPGGLTVSGHTAGTLHLGAGGEAILFKGVGLGAEIGALGPTEAFSEAVGVLSVNGYYHFLRGKVRKLDPFATGGYTLMFREGSQNLFNFGGGVNYWFLNWLGAKVEFRDHVWPCDHCTTHFWGARFGVTFR